MKDLEAVYDAEIAPLMAQILAICQREGLPMFATFQYADGAFCRSMLTATPEAHPIFDHLNLLAQCTSGDGVNLDTFMFAQAREAQKTGHSSMVLRQMGVPIQPESPTHPPVEAIG